ncbi:hypothetical protein VTO58DRAFT_109334 [Aureobasidium pullulans]
MPTLLPDRLLTNITILVPNGTTQHSNERILCLPITPKYWPSISAVVVFFAANFLAHAVTVKSSPGDATCVQACNAFLALMFPTSGLLRALNAILRFSRAAQTGLDKACRAGALCMVVRGRHWQPEDLSDLRVGVVHRLQEEDDTRPIDADLITYLPVYAREKSSSWIYFDSVWAQSYVDIGLKRIHGTFELPEGYTFAVVPRDAILVPKANARDGRNSTNDISASISIPKAVASMVQIVSAFVALQSHRSDLISRWGYASYHLAVIPYLIMTLVNLIGNICIADYPCLYMVRTDIMNEAEKVGGIFEGEIAHTIALMDTCDDLVEDLPYCGVTIEDIISIATSFPPSMVIFWQFSLVLHILAIFFYILGKAEPQISSASKSMAVDLHVSRTSRNLHAEQLSAVSDATGTVSDEQRNQSSEGSSNLPGRGEAEHEIEMLAADVCNFEDEPKVRFVEALSSSRRYRIRICSPSKSLRVYGVYKHTSAMDDRAKRSGRPARCASQSTSMTLVRVLHLWLQECGAPRQILYLIRKHSSFGEHESVPANLTKFYYPNCSKFLRARSLNHHMISGTLVTLIKAVHRDATGKYVSNQ